MVRARWLGYRAAYASDAIVYHIGSLSSGGPDSDFVLYHGIRNSIWWLVKNAIGWFLLSLPWFVALHVAIWIRHLRRGKARVLWRLYRDAMRGIPEMRRKRAIIKIPTCAGQNIRELGGTAFLSARLRAARVAGVIQRRAKVSAKRRRARREDLRYLPHLLIAESGYR